MHQLISSSVVGIKSSNYENRSNGYLSVVLTSTDSQGKVSITSLREVGYFLLETKVMIINNRFFQTNSYYSWFSPTGQGRHVDWQYNTISSCQQRDRLLFLLTTTATMTPHANKVPSSNVIETPAKYY